jgi:hypothetical protein
VTTLWRGGHGEILKSESLPVRPAFVAEYIRHKCDGKISAESPAPRGETNAVAFYKGIPFSVARIKRVV